MTNRRVRRVLLGCVLSNTLIASVGLASGGLTSAPSPVAASPTISASVLDELAASPDTTAAPVTTTAAPTITVPTTRASTTASTASHKKSPSAKAAAAAEGPTGIEPSVAPPGRIAPEQGSYAATFSGTASVNGDPEKVPSSGSVVFSPSGSDLSQTSPNVPGDVVLVQSYSAASTDLVSFSLGSGSTKKTFRPATPVTFLRYDATPGSTWSWQTKSTDNKTTVSTTGAVIGNRTVNVGGQDIATIEIETTITISGDVRGSATLTTWVSPAHRLPVKQHQVINATASGPFGFSARVASDITSVLTSLTPR